MLSDSKIKRKPKLSSPNKPRKCATVFQVRELETTFERDPRPSHDKRLELADKLDMHPRTVQIWFQNRRAKAR
ncbi:homeobox-domain-containing protein, partial [Neoconidiobolus thromboides FSU 785]